MPLPRLWTTVVLGWITLICASVMPFERFSITTSYVMLGRMGFGVTAVHEMVFVDDVRTEPFDGVVMLGASCGAIKLVMKSTVPYSPQFEGLKSLPQARTTKVYLHEREAHPV
jgi:hypothetical protein